MKRVILAAGVLVGLAAAAHADSIIKLEDIDASVIRTRPEVCHGMTYYLCRKGQTFQCTTPTYFAIRDQRCASKPTRELQAKATCVRLPLRTLRCGTLKR